MDKQAFRFRVTIAPFWNSEPSVYIESTLASDAFEAERNIRERSEYRHAYRITVEKLN